MDTKKTLLIILFVLAIASLACNFGQRTSTPVPTIPVTTESVDDLEETVEEALREAQETGDIELVLTEPQLTSILAFELEDIGTNSLSDPQVRLQDGQIEITSMVTSSSLSATAQVVMQVTIDGAGRPVFSVTSASIGPIPIPEDLTSEVEIRLNMAFQERLDEMAPDLFIESIVIEDGTMTITGRTNSQ